jgi:(p)ppGpp synthase/HD superfamily hydrolase
MGKQFFTSRFIKAFELSNQLHTNQYRKGSNVPYVSHLLAVAALVIEDGGDEDQAIAALLHDAVEDQGGYETLDIIKEHFGNRVARIVKGCSDSFHSPKPDWFDRKQKYLTHLQAADQDILRVSLADKLHNARSILADLQNRGDSVWEWFNGGRDGTLWYYQSLLLIFRERSISSMVEEFENVLLRIEETSANS